MSVRLSQAWRGTVARDPGAFALATAEDGRAWTRGQLQAEVAAWCAGAAASLSLARRRVAMCEPNGPGWWRVFLGLLEVDAIPVVVDATEPPVRQREIADGAGAAWLCSGGEWVPIAPRRRTRAADLCLVKLTSGSTGQPRAWPFTHGQMLADGAQVCASMGIRPEDTNLAAIPLGHSYGLGNLVVPLMAQGTAVVVVNSPLPHILAAAAAAWRCSVFPAVPALLDALVRSTVEPSELAALRLVVSAGAAMPPALARAFRDRFGIAVHNFYGSSETGGISYDRAGEATAEGRSVGTPLDGVRLRWEAGRRFQVASAAVGGRGVFSPLDFGRLNEWGELVLAGRAGRVVKVGARRLDLGEIEAALRSVPGVREAYVAVQSAPRQMLAAAVAADLTKDELRTALAGRLASWKMPHRLAVVPALPTTARGKLDRAAVDALLASPAPATRA